MEPLRSHLVHYGAWLYCAAAYLQGGGPKGEVTRENECVEGRETGGMGEEEGKSEKSLTAVLYLFSL